MSSRILLYVIFISLIHFSGVFSQDSFYAYHTKVSHSATDYFGKYADLIVVVGEDRQLEFTRRTQYRPEWVTPNGSYMVDDFFPGRDLDYNLEYTYVRLMEESPEKIVVHWRSMPDLEIIKKANARLDPTFIEGITGVVHEMFTIYPDGKVEREVKHALGSTWESWNKENYGDRQTLNLHDKGIDHGKVKWGNKRGDLQQKVESSPVFDMGDMSPPAYAWKFDEGTAGPPFEIEEGEEWEFANTVFEERTEESSPVQGHMAYFRKGVSGTALGFDGYYTGISFEDDLEEIGEEISMEAWLAVDMYPFNEAPVIHRSQGFGEKGFYLGVDPYGKLLLRVNGSLIKSGETLPLYTWTHVAATIEKGKAILYLDGKSVGVSNFTGDFNDLDQALTIGINTEKERCTDYVRGYDQNIPFIYGIQGMLDEVKVYDKALSADQVKRHYTALLPDDRTSPLPKGVLPGELGVAKKFGAYYKNLEYHDLWDRMWRLTDGTDIVVKFEHTPASVVWWRGTNFAANWITDNNRWMADQSSEIFTRHGCSEHMSDKQTRHSYARLIENNDARVVVHWRYPCVDVGYVCIDRMNYTDEYHTIYPDGTGIRKVVYNNTTTEAPGFQDIQYFTNPGETALDVVELNAVTVGNVKGETDEMVWVKPNKNPQTDLENATIQYINTKSRWKVYALYPEPGIGTWGDFEQSNYTDDPFAGPWNHWPISLVPSDGRYAVAHDRVTHFALGAGDAGEEAIVHYGFTDQEITTLVPRTKYWQNPPEVSNVKGLVFIGFDKAQKAFVYKKGQGKQMLFDIKADKQSPLVNPAFVIHDCGQQNVTLTINGNAISKGKEFRVGREYDTKGNPMLIIWVEYESEQSVSIDLTVQ